MANVLKALLARLNQSAVAVVPLALLGGAAYGIKESIYTGAHPSRHGHTPQVLPLLVDSLPLGFEFLSQ